MLTDKTRGGIRESRWRDFVDSVEGLNAFVHPKALRRYQQELLNADGFTVVSPHSGSPVTVRNGVPLRGRIAYLVEDGTRTWLLTGLLQFGHPLAEMFVESDGTCRSISRDANEDSDRIRPAELRTLRDKTFVENHDTGSTILIGHPNFAHHLWNELSALDEWTRHAPDSALDRTRLLASFEPFGPLESIFPRLRKGSIDGRGIRGAVHRTREQSRIVRVGSRIVTSRVRKAICDFCNSHNDEKSVASARSLLKEGTPRIWISVRHRSRTSENQVDFLLAAFRKIFHAFPEAGIVLDGFSYPHGFLEDPRMAQFHESFRAVATSVGALIGEIVERAQSDLGRVRASRLLSISGLGLVDAIHIGSFCDYYVCHAGTLQHKVAWLHDIPGIIHMPFPSAARAHWNGEQVEDGRTPDIFPASLISPEPQRRGTIGPSRNRNYTITNVEDAADYIVTSIRKSTEP